MRITLLLKSFTLLVVMSACNSLSNGQKSQLLSVNDFEKKLTDTKESQLLDVRTPEEYAEKHLLDAVNINFNADDFIDKVEHLDKSKPVFVYCLSGGRSAKATALISKKGFKQVYDLDGGILAWTAAKKAVETPAGVATTAKGMTMDDYLAKVKSDKLVLVDFNAVWCGPCKILKPILEKVATEKKDKVTVLPIDVDKNPALSDAFHIQGIPLMILYKGGKEVWRNMGLTDEKTINGQIADNSK